MVENYEEGGHGFQGPHWQTAGDRELHADVRPLRLEVRHLDAPPQWLVLDSSRRILVGRHTCADIRLAYPEVSRRHCQLAFQDGYWHIVDLNSLNGLFINGERIHEAVLQQGDVIRLGSVTMAVQPHEKTADVPLTGVLRSIADNLV